MDQIKIGKFIAQLRNEKKWTQQQLSEMLGVTNKTISRWENGHYLPDVEMMQELSKLYNITMNELLSGERLEYEQYKKKAEENLVETLKDSPFTLQEKITFFKRKWQKEHRFKIVLCLISWCVLMISLYIQGVEEYLIATIGGLLAIVFYVVLYHQMMRYVEKNAYD